MLSKNFEGFSGEKPESALRHSLDICGVEKCCLGQVGRFNGIDIKDISNI
jgi:hypothetical protein